MGKAKKLLVAICVSMVMVLIVPIVMPNVSNGATVEAATKVKLNKKKATLYVGNTLKLKISGTSEKVKWSTNKGYIATVSAKGKVKAKKAGKATITAEVGGKKYKCKVTVKEKVGENSDNQISSTNTRNNIVPVSSLAMSEPQKTVYVGSKVYLFATINPRNATNRVITWTSSNTNVATVESDNLATVTGKSPGTAIITAAIDDKIATCTVTVLPTYSVSIKNALSVDASYDKISISVTNNGIYYIYLGNYSNLEERYMKVGNALAGAKIYQSNETGYCLLPATQIAPGETKIITVGRMYTSKFGNSYYTTYHLSNASYFEIPLYEGYDDALIYHTEKCYVSQ